MMTLTQLLDRLQPDERILSDGKRRQAQVWRNEEADSLPIILAGKLPADLAELPRYNLKECFYDKEKMLWNALLDMIALLEGRSDGVPSMRANTGVGTVASVFGCQQQVFEDKMPWVAEHLPRERVQAADIRHPARRGDMPRVLEYMEYFVEKLEGRAGVFCADVQSPFDTAHLICGDALFTALYDDPEFVHSLMDKVARVYVEVVRAMKKVNGEKPDESWHSNGLYAVRAGTRSCEDTTTLVSADHVQEFALRYTARCLRAFDGGWVHYCGDGKNMFSSLMKMDLVRGVNFGNPEMHDMPGVMRDLLAAGKVYFGSFPRAREEDVRAYFQRVLNALGGARRGLIFAPQVREEDGEPAALVDLWRALQEEGAVEGRAS
jgi:hypothetical protein